MRHPGSARAVDAQPDSTKVFVEAVDAATGEQITIVTQRTSSDRAAGPWFMGYQQKIQQISHSPVLTAGDKEIFLELLTILDFNNYVLINVGEIAKNVGRSRESVSRSLKHLADNGVIHKGPKVGQSYSYLMDTDTAWRGKIQDKPRVRREIADRHLKAVESAPDNEK